MHPRTCSNILYCKYFTVLINLFQQQKFPDLRYYMQSIHANCYGMPNSTFTNLQISYQCEACHVTH